MSEKFTASNGVDLEVTEEGHIIIPPVTTGLGEVTQQALREFFLHERDQELGRWRDPELPHFYVVSNERGQKIVVDERDSRWSPVTRELIEKFPDLVEPHEVAARYYAAHPLPKPWHGAQHGQVWALTVDGQEKAFTLHGDLFRTGNLHDIEQTDRHITAGRRIWPEAVES